MKRDGKYMFYIHQAMHECIVPRVAVAITTKKAWDTLETSYQSFDKVKTSKLQILRRDFESLSMKETKWVDSFYTWDVGLINLLKYHGETIEDKRVVEKNLRCLPTRFKFLVVSLEEKKACRSLPLMSWKLHSSIMNT